MSPRSRRIRALFLTNMWPIDEHPAYGAFVAAQAESLRAAGIEVEVEFINARTRSLAYLRGALHMLALNVEPRRYDVVHAHTGHCGALALLQRRYPTIISFVGYDLYGKHTSSGDVTSKSRWEARLFRQLGGFAAATITKSEDLERRLPLRLRDRNTVLPNGVNRTVFRRRPRSELRALLDWPQNERTVVFVGDPEVPRKRHALAVAACEAAQRHLPDVALRTCHRVRHEDVAVWLSAADVLILPSLAEGSPNAVKEAAACGLPVVATDVGDVAETLAGVEPSAVVPIDADAQSIGKALVDVLLDGRRSNGPERTERLAADAVARRLIDVYERVLQASGRHNIDSSKASA